MHILIKHTKYLTASGILFHQKKKKVHRDILSNRIQNKPNPLNNSLKIFRSLKQSLPAKMKATLRRTDRMSD